MKARVAKVVAPRKLEIVEEEIPQLKAGEVLIKVKSCGLCHTEVPIYEGRKGPFGKRKVGGYECGYQEDKPRFPTRIGHEPTGTVVEVGPEVSRFEVGDLVSGLVGGGFRTHLVTAGERLCRLPDGLALELENALAEPLMCVANVVRVANPEIGDYVAVIGAGFMGLLVDAGLAKHPLRELIAIDLVDERLDWARKMGATVTINPKKEIVEQRIEELTGGRGVDVAIDITGRYAGLATAAKIIKRGRGKILAPSYYGQAETIDIGPELMNKAPIIISAHPQYSMNYLYDMETGIWAAAKRIFPIGELITHRFAFEDINNAFQALATNPEGYVKGIVVMD